MEDVDRTREDFLNELASLRQQLSDLKAVEADHNRTEEVAARMDEANYRTIFDAANDGIFVHDIESGAILDVNEKACEMFCYPKDELVRLRVHDISSGETPYMQEDALRHIRQAADGEPQLFEWHCKDKAGRLFWVEVNLKRAVIGGKYRLLAIVRDITNRKQTEEIFQFSHFSIEKAGESIFWIGEDAEVLYVNDATCRSLGYSHEELLKMSVPDIDPNFPKERWPSHWQELKERGSFVFESRHRAKDGTTFPVEVSVNYLEFDGKGYNFAFARDITERKKQEKALERRDYQMEILSRTSQHINAVLEIPIIMRTLVGAALELVDAEGGTAGLWVDGKMEFSEYYKEGRAMPFNYVFESGVGVPGLMANTMKPYISNDAQKDPQVIPEIRKALGIYNFVGVPILNRKSELLGCFLVHNKKDRVPFDTQDVFMLQGLAASGAVALENAKALVERKNAEEERERLHEGIIRSHEKLKEIALKDPQTGLYNHRYITEFIESEFYRAKRYNHPLSIIMIDIDYFKSINDAYGHAFGDLVLKQFSQYLRKIVRRYDIVVRFGGEEFVIISSGTDRGRALDQAQRILDAITLYNFGDSKHTVKLKLSIAIASYPEDGIAKGMDLINLADKILGKAKDAGGNRIYDYPDISKGKAALAKRAGPATTKLLKKKIRELTKRGKQSLVESIFAFAKTIELKDHYTGEHVEKTVNYSTKIARALKFYPEEVENVREASILHDLGKIGITDKILFKKSKLTKMEYEEIKKHPQIAADIIRPIQFMHDIVPLILYHHERWDGKGYPSGLKGEEIPIGARIIAIADVYQALTSNRPYRKAFSRKKAIEIIKKGAGTQFDPDIVNVFLKIIKKEK